MKKIVRSGPASTELIELPETAGTLGATATVPAYWAEACKHLVTKDRVMKRLIPQFGDTCLHAGGDAFSTLARSIVGQQISVKAAQTVWHRFAALPKAMSPGHVLRLKVDDMRAAGLSPRKIEYLVDLSIHFDAGTVHVTDWQSMDDDAIIAELVAIRGIGRWTAEMFLIFYLTSYGQNFDTPGKQSRKDWEIDRRARIVGKSHISVKLSNLSIAVQGRKATAKFKQDYSAESLNVSSRKTLEMAKVGDHWLIVKEFTGS